MREVMYGIHRMEERCMLQAEKGLAKPVKAYIFICNYLYVCIKV